MARVVQELAGDRVIRTEAELRNVLETRAVEAPARKIWIHEDLEDAVRRTLERERYTIKH